VLVVFVVKLFELVDVEVIATFVFIELEVVGTIATVEELTAASATLATISCMDSLSLSSSLSSSFSG